MTTDRHLSPADAAVALHSFPRRFRAVLARPGDDERFDPDEVGRRIGPDGTSAAEHLLAADGVLALLDRALEQARRGDDSALHPTFADLSGARWDDEHSPIPALLDQFEATANRAASRVESIDADAWAAPVTVAGVDATRERLSILQDAVGVVADHLRAAQRVIDAVV